MKSLTAVCQTGASMPAINPAGRISRHTHPRHGANSGENAEMKMYLSKLKDLVPFMPKNRKLSKLEIIQHVIDYICDLQTELETHPEINNFDAAAALNFTAALQQQQQQQPMQSDEDEVEEEDDQDQDETIANAGGDVDEQDQDMLLSHRLAADVHQQQQQQQQQQKSSLNAQRQPLVDRQAPNTFLPASVNATQAAPTAAPATHVAATQQPQQLQQQQQQQQQAAPSLQTQIVEKERQSRSSTC